MSRNSGKASEAAFVTRYRKLGKRCYVYRFRDMSDLFGMNGGKKFKLPPLPSDFLVVHNGAVQFAEVKSTQDPRAFRFSMLSKDQWAAAVKITAALGTYMIYVHNLLSDTWYKVPFSYCVLTKDAGMNSLSWTEMGQFQW